MFDATIIQAIEAGGNLGLLLMGLSLMRLHVRISKLELRHEMKMERERQRDGHET